MSLISTPSKNEALAAKFAKLICEHLYHNFRKLSSCESPEEFDEIYKNDSHLNNARDEYEEHYKLTMRPEIFKEELYLKRIRLILNHMDNFFQSTENEEDIRQKRKEMMLVRERLMEVLQQMFNEFEIIEGVLTS